MPDRDDPEPGDTERFAEAADLARPAGAPDPAPTDAALARDLDIVAALRALDPAGPGRDVEPDEPEIGALARSAWCGVLADRRTDVGALADADAWAEAKARVRARVMAAASADGSPTNDPPDDSPADGGGQAERLPGPRVELPASASDGLVTATRSATAVTPLVPRPMAARRRRHSLPRTPAARPALARRAGVVGSAALLMGVALAACGVLASRDAVPGDPLYGVKRAAEAAGGVFAAGEGPQARRDLHLAVTRLDEIEQMARVTPDPVLLTSTMRDLDTAAASGSRLVLADRDGSDAPHAPVDLATWADQQTARLSALRDTLPDATRPAVDDVLRLLDRIQRRATALAARNGCAQVTSGVVDDLGPLPASGPCWGPSTPAPAPPTTTHGPVEAAPVGEDVEADSGPSDDVSRIAPTTATTRAHTRTQAPSRSAAVTAPLSEPADASSSSENGTPDPGTTLAAPGAATSSEDAAGTATAPSSRPAVVVQLGTWAPHVTGVSPG